VTHRVQASSFNLRAYEVKNLVSTFAFKWVFLYRYGEGGLDAEFLTIFRRVFASRMVGRGS
jgi:hypothetical protein